MTKLVMELHNEPSREVQATVNAVDTIHDAIGEVEGMVNDMVTEGTTTTTNQIGEVEGVTEGTTTTTNRIGEVEGLINDMVTEGTTTTTSSMKEVNDMAGVDNNIGLLNDGLVVEDAAVADTTMMDRNEDERAIAMTKRNLRQEQLAMKAMRQCRTGVELVGVSPGAVITLKVDYRVHSHAYGLLGIVYQVKDTGGVLVACEHGVITDLSQKDNN